MKLRLLLLLCSLFLLGPETATAAFVPHAPAAPPPRDRAIHRFHTFFHRPAGGVPKAQEARTNGWAVASLVCGLASLIVPVGLVFGPLAVLFGILALDSRRRRKNKGLGLALAGMLLGAIGFVAVFLLIRPL